MPRINELGNMNGRSHHGRTIGTKRLVATLLWLVSLFACHAQLDTSFWFVAPEVCQWNNPTNFDRPIKLVFSTPGNVPATVTISQPANPAFTPIQQNVPANGSATVDLTSHIADIENAPTNTVLNKGLHISSTQPVNAYYEVCMTGLTPEVYALKGRNALGTNFFVPGQNEYMNGDTYQPTPLNRVDVVATQNNTVVTFTPRVAIEGHAAGVPFSVTLNKGQTYCYAAVGRQPANHFVGSTITSSQPIAVTESDDLLHHPSGGQDLVGDQTIPVEQAGLEFVAIKGELYQQADKVYVTATENNTHIYVNGLTTAVATLNAGQTHPIGFGANSSTLYITSDRPVYAFQLTGLGHEFGSAVLPSVQNTGSTQVSYKRSTGSSRQMTFNLIARAGTEGNFTLNGSSTAIQATDFHPVAGTNGGWVYASLDIPTSVVDANQTAVVRNPAPFHLGVFEGGTAGGCSYGFFSDYQRYIASDAATYVACAGENITIHITSIGDYNVNWYADATGNNIIHTGTSYTVTKNQDSVQYVYAQLFAANAFGDRLQIPILLTTLCGDTLDGDCEGRVLYHQDFGGNSVSDPWISPTDIVGGHSDLLFSGTSTSSGHYCLVKKCSETWAVQPNFDHSHLGDPDIGYFMYPDPGPNQMNAILYEIPINGLCDNARLNFSLWATDLQRNYAHPAFEMQLINSDDSSILVRSHIVEVPRNNPLIWHQYGFSYSLSNNVHDVIFRIINKNVDNIGNDWAIDDIKVTYCGGEALILNPSADTTFCLGEPVTLSALFVRHSIPTDATLEYEWQYSPDGVNWQDLPNSGHLQYSIQSMSRANVGFYRIQVAETGLLDGLCSFYSESIHIAADSCFVEPCDTLFLSDSVCMGMPYENYGFSLTQTQTNYAGNHIFDRHTIGANGCDSLIRLSLKTLPLPQFKIEDGGVDFCEEYRISLEVQPAMEAYVWSTGATTQSVEVMQSGHYTVTATQGECSYSVPYTVSACTFNIFVPNAISFTNKDGLNDYFQIYCPDPASIRDFEIRIYNRWGELVFMSKDPMFRWRPDNERSAPQNSFFNYSIRYRGTDGAMELLKGAVLVL